MGKRPISGIGLTAFFGEGADGWAEDMDNNMLKLSVLTQSRVQSIGGDLPSEPAPGELPIRIATQGSSALAVSVFDNDAWVSFAPEAGWRTYSIEDSAWFRFDGDAWINEDAVPAVTRKPIMILASGTSNMFSTLARTDANPWPSNMRVWNWNGSTGSTGTAFVPVPTGDMRLSFEFAARVANEHPDADVYVVPVTWGVATYADFTGTTANRYDQALQRNAAAAIAAVSGATQYDYMLWWCGEADATNLPPVLGLMNTFFDGLNAQPWFDINHINTIMFGIVDAPRAPWRNHGQLNYITKQFCAASGGARVYVPCGQFRDSALWQPDIGATVSPLMSELGLKSAGQLAWNALSGNTTFTAQTHADNMVAGVLETFKGLMFPQYEFGAIVPPILHDFQSTMKRYQERYRNEFSIVDANPPSYERRNVWEQMTGNAYVVRVNCLWNSGNGGNMRIGAFMPFQNNSGSNVFFQQLLVDKSAGAAASDWVYIPVIVRWSLWTMDLEFFTLGTDGKLTPVVLPSAGEIDMVINTYQT